MTINNFEGKFKIQSSQKTWTVYINFFRALQQGQQENNNSKEEKFINFCKVLDNKKCYF